MDNNTEKNKSGEYTWDFFSHRRDLAERREAESKRRIGAIVALAVGCAVVIISLMLIAIAL